ncbi:hypothetical protein G5T09_02740 [Legionella pneumophila serogroup 1]|uniref:hypothetical protein n=1 Tax=Legionella pneumophila TaxID=446 RepID=UPI000770A297|nr:hypothetical protein [Legionella pneumophila]HAT8944566.1 hypothetical protein [Legionella pneumophila subsp. pneumophila]MCH9059906.1 hypothetical protein [Legionella pneumophila serogroup 1]MCH9062400.1 hypothetical protein [Legionella pneumophila serogroup 1]MCH9065488.1 hypothetical protein [Legionella pneumophila serogroup 1]MCH9068473.1 hypothetical protein [Legionella pneumophila serogroup 1]
MTIPLLNIENDDVKMLNRLLEKYNEQPSLYMLQLIDNYQKMLKSECIKNNPSYAQEFIRWARRDYVTAEIDALADNKFNKINTRAFETGFKEVKRDLNIEAAIDKWKGIIRDMDCLKKHGERAAIDTSILKIQMAVEAIKINPKNEVHQILLVNCLSEFRQYIIKELIIQENKISKLPDAIARPDRQGLKTLLKEINFQIDKTIKNHQLSEHNRFQRSEVPIPELTEVCQNKTRLENLVSNLHGQENFQLGKFNLKPLGGNNNKNWLAKNNEGDCYIVRLEKLLPKEILMEKIQTIPEITKHLANDFYNYPTETTYINGFGNQYNVALSEFCPRKDMLSFRYDLAGQSQEKIIDEVIKMTEQVTGFALALNKAGLAYSDIKAENFLLRENKEVVTADRKSIVSHDNNKDIILNGSGSVAKSFTLPECREVKSNAERFMAYQIGVMLHVLMEGDKVNKPHGTASYKNQDELGTIAPFDFNHDIYTTDAGKEVMKLIQNLTNENPHERLSLMEVIQKCENIRENLSQNIIENQEEEERNYNFA